MTQNKPRPIKLIKELVGLLIWEVSIGPSGVDIQLGRRKLRKNGLEEGEIAIWIQTDTRIHKGQKLIDRSLFPQGKEKVKIYRKYLEGKKILKSKIHYKTNALYLLIEPNTTLSILPGAKKTEKPWIIYDKRLEHPTGIVVYSNGVEFVL